jgi:hypothetical protein
VHMHKHSPAGEGVGGGFPIRTTRVKA